MARRASDVLTDELVELAQIGRHREVLARIEQQELSGADLPAGLFFARSVALEVTAEHAAAARSAGAGVAAAIRENRQGWRAACLAMRALQLIKDGSDGPSGVDDAQVLHDLAQAQVALSREVVDPCELSAAVNCLGLAYLQLRLYELARPVLESAVPQAGSDPEAMAAGVVIQQLNLAELELTWALELFRAGLPDDADQHCGTALAHARSGESRAAGPFRDAWQRRARVLAGCALGLSADLPAAAASIATAREELATLKEVGNEHERGFCAPLLGLALARIGRHDEGLTIVTAALAEVHAHTDPLLVAATWHAELVLLAPSSRGARAGLELGHALSLVLWRQRARRLAAAEAMLRFEQLHAAHETVSRETDVDALTGTATRRALDRRFTALEARREAGGGGAGVIVVDVDGLKRVNDGFGPRAGDRVLRGIGGALLSTVRAVDLVGRFGGDEFVILVDDDGAPQGLGDLARQVMLAVRTLEWPDDLGRPPKVSVGLARADRRRSLEQALVAADRAMYRVKRTGGDAAMVAAPPALEPAAG